MVCMMLTLTGIAETALYVDDLERANAFYTGLFSCPVMARNERLCALEITKGQTLLLFLRHASTEPVTLAGGVLPAHDGSGPLHVCFGVAPDELTAWERRLNERGIPLESRIEWPSGATSLYFRDPDWHAVELATPGVWQSAK